MDRRSRQAAGKRLSLSPHAALIAALLIALSARAQDENWRHDRTCGKREPAMAAVKDKTCYRAWCSDTSLGKLCACVEENGDRIQFALESKGGVRREWNASFIPPMGGDASHFRIDRIGEQSLLLAVMRSESVGIAVSDWSVWAIDPQRISRPLEVQNYGTFSFATRPSAGARCLLLAARWHSGWEPGRGHGMYIAGSWYAVENDAFARVEDRPAIYRRYLSGLESARYAAEERGRPLPWFRAAAPVIGPRPVTGKEP